MGDFERHLNLAREKLKAVLQVYKNKQYTVVGDLAIKVVEQLRRSRRFKGRRALWELLYKT